MVQDLNSLPEVREAFTKHKIVVLKYYAQWCGPCRVLGPKFEELVRNTSNPNVAFYAIDVDEASDVAEEYPAQSMPTCIYFVNGTKTAEVIGSKIEEVSRVLDEVIAAHGGSAPAAAA